MKRLLFLMTTLVIYSSGYSQINVIEAEPGETIGKVKNQLDTSLEATKRGDEYTIMYEDIESQQIKEFQSFTLNEQSFNGLYNLITRNWEIPPEENIRIDLKEGGILWLNFARMRGVTHLQFVHSVDDNANEQGRSQYLSKRQVDKLFGKR